MKFLTIDCREVGGRPGVLLPDGDILDLAAAPSTLNQAQWIPHSVVSVLAAGQDGLDRTARLVDAVSERDQGGREQLRRDGVVMPFAGTVLLPPVRRPGLLLVVAEDGRAHIKSPNTAVGSGATVAPPWNGDAPLECSAMLGAVTGRPLYRAGRDEAAESIAGYTLVLDLSNARTGDWQDDIERKQFPGASPIGPAIVTTDELAEPRAHTLELALNDVVVASGPAFDHADDMPARLAELSQRYSFRPGDLICAERPTEDPLSNCRLRDGDVVRLSMQGMMSLDTAIAIAA